MNKFAIVVSYFNNEITDKLLEGALAHLQTAGINKERVKVVTVPGAVEIPLAAQLLARSGHYQAIICLSAVIRGETNHYDYVCEQVSQGCQRVMLDFSLPIIFGVLTTETVEQALERVGGKEGHKGKEAAATALMMAELICELNNPL